MRANTHKARLLDYLLENGSITQKQSTDALGNTRLAATVFHLRKELELDGKTIGVKTKEVATRYKNQDGTTKTTQVAEYYLEALGMFNPKYNPVGELDSIINELNFPK
jgi:hypothetical protein